MKVVLEAFMLASLRSRFLVLLVGLITLQGCATVYSAKEIEAHVIDVETRQPLEGVNVVAHWVVSFGIEGGQQTDLMLMETVTDRNGRFHFPAWGPIGLPGHLPWEARMKNQDPEIILFKSGYEWDALFNDRPGPHADAGPLVRTSMWHGKTIEMKPFKGSLEQYASAVTGVLTGVSYGRCRWKQIPRMIVALDREAERIEKQGVYTGLGPTIRDLQGSSINQGCGSVEEFFREYLK